MCSDQVLGEQCTRSRLKTLYKVIVPILTQPFYEKQSIVSYIAIFLLKNAFVLRIFLLLGGHFPLSNGLGCLTKTVRAGLPHPACKNNIDFNCEFKCLQPGRVRIKELSPRLRAL